MTEERRPTRPAAPYLEPAIAGGLRFLAREQRPSGEFPTYSSRRPDFAEASPVSKTVYTTTYVIQALSHLPARPHLVTIRQRALDFLHKEQDLHGFWNYFGRGDSPIPPDLDDLSCAVAALVRCGQPPPIRFYALLWQNETEPGGPYYTWLGVNHHARHPLAREIDALVNANVLFCASLLGLSLPGTEVYLNQFVAGPGFDRGSRYCPTPHFLIYVLSRAYADGPAVALRSAVPHLRTAILAGLPPPAIENDAFKLACLATALLNLAAPTAVIDPYLSALLRLQQLDGRWPGSAAWRAIQAENHGGPALTTALALEAIEKYRHRFRTGDPAPGQPCPV